MNKGEICFFHHHRREKYCFNAAKGINDALGFCFSSIDVIDSKRSLSTSSWKVEINKGETKTKKKTSYHIGIGGDKETEKNQMTTAKTNERDASTTCQRENENKTQTH